ncbi:MAG: septation protein IspZ [Pseudomonadota bacterium]
MVDRQVSSGLKTALELGPLIIFFVLVLLWRGQSFDLMGGVYSGFVTATLAFIPVLLVAIGIMWAVAGRASQAQILIGLIVLVFGGLAFWFQDATYGFMRPTYTFFIFSAILVIGIMRGQSYLRTLLGDVIPMFHEGWMILARRVVVLFCVLALINEGVWRFLGVDVWVPFKTYALPGLLFLFAVLQIRLFRLYEDDF